MKRSLVLTLLALAACGGAAGSTPTRPAPVASTPAPKKPTPWVMTGVVRNAAGQPVPGAEVYADNTVYYNMNVIGKTDAQGRYRLELPHEIGTWRAGASIKRPWGDQVFKFTVYPDDASAFQAREGAVRNFVWRIQGKHDGAVLGQKVNVYYGGQGEVDFDTLELTFVPHGALIDGSAGKTFKRKYDGAILDVPVGRYRVSATHVVDGRVEAVDVQPEGGEYGPTALATFRESLYGIRMELSVRGR